MPGHRVLSDWRTVIERGDAAIADPGASGTFALKGKTFATVTVTATGTYTLPNAACGTVLYVTTDDTSVVTLADSGGTIHVFTGTSGTTGVLCIATDSNSWAASRFAQASAGALTAANVSIADAGSYTATTTVETALQQLYGRSELQVPDITAYTASAATGTLTAAAIAGGVINRSGPTTDYTDTTHTAAQIVAAAPTNLDTASAYLSWFLIIKNTVAFAETLAAGSGVTLSGQSVVAPNSTGLFHVLIVDPGSGTEAVTITGLGTMSQAAVPNATYTTIATDTTITAAAGTLTGGRFVTYRTTAAGAGGIALTTRTAAQMYADIPNCHVGFSYMLLLVSQGGGTVTLTDGGSVTITGTATVATKTTRLFHVTFTSTTACTMTSVSKGTIE